MTRATTGIMSGAELKGFRKDRKLTQNEFWAAVGVSQTCASRYEQGRRIPPGVRMSLEAVYGQKDPYQLASWIRSGAWLVELSGYAKAKPPCAF